MKLSLVVQTEGKASGQVISVGLAQFIIGRDPQCNLRPASALISKRHCALILRGEEVFLRDFDSTNGTFLNEVPVKGEVSVKNNDMLRVGPLKFKVAIEASKVVAAPRPTPAPATSENAPVAQPKPAPVIQPKAPAKVPAAASADDDIAALLLSLPGDGAEEGSTSEESGVPSGSTVMDMMVPKEVLDAAAQEEDKSKTPQPATKPAPKKEEKKADTAQNAAKAILEKYSRRGR